MELDLPGWQNPLVHGEELLFLWMLVLSHLDLVQCGNLKTLTKTNGWEKTNSVTTKYRPIHKRIESFISCNPVTMKTYSKWIANIDANQFLWNDYQLGFQNHFATRNIVS